MGFVFVAGLTGVWLMQRVSRKQGGIRLVMVSGQAFVVGPEKCTFGQSHVCHL